MSDSRLDIVAGVLADPGNAERTADEVAQLVLDALERARKRTYRYVVIVQDRSPRPTTAALWATKVPLAPPPENPRQFYPTWVLGPFYTLLEASAAARPEREAGRKAMTAQVFLPGEEIDPDSLKEVLA